MIEDGCSALDEEMNASDAIRSVSCECLGGLGKGEGYVEILG